MLTVSGTRLRARAKTLDRRRLTARIMPDCPLAVILENLDGIRSEPPLALARRPFEALP